MRQESSNTPIALSELFERGRNSFSVLRLLLATAVILSHSYYLPSFGLDPLERWSGLRLGAIAVDGFFALSGMLVTASLCRNASVVNFIRHRLARLMPGFWACLLFCAFILAPISIAIDCGWSSLLTAAAVKSLLGYVAKNSALLIVEPTLPNVLSSLSYRRINPCLWTLAPEACCYALLALASAMKLFGRSQRWLLALAFGVGMISLSGLAMNLTLALGGPPLIRLIELGMHFLGGVLTILFLPRLRLSLAVTLALGATYALCVIVEPLHFLRVPLLAPTLAGLARVIPLHGRCDRLDASYGLYLYGSALQQLLVWAGLLGTGPWSFFALSMSVTAPVALLSWIAIERPALLRWGRRRLGESETFVRSKSVEPAKHEPGSENISG